jgi:hypothetical protein
MSELLPSQVRIYKDRIKQLEDDKRQIYACCLRRVTRIINTSSISEAEKKDLLEMIWEE